MYRKFQFSNPGAFLATTLSIVSSLVFAYFVNNFGQYNQIYGSIGALIVLLLWLQINAVILLIGFELNTSIAVERDNQDSKNFSRSI
jgi:membrane protein